MPDETARAHVQEIHRFYLGDCHGRVPDSVDVTIMFLRFEVHDSFSHPHPVRLSGTHASLESFQSPREQDVAADAHSKILFARLNIFGTHCVTSETRVTCS